MVTDRRNTDRRKKTREEQPTLLEMRAVFHRLWGVQVGSPEYRKRDWQELQQMIYRLFKVEV